MDIVEEIARGLIVGVLMFCLISIADNLQTIKDNTTPTCACEVLD